MKSLDIIISVLMVGVAAIFPLLFSYAIGGWVKAKMSTFRFANIPDMTGKTVMVTGINTGIGKVTAVQLALKGATVIGTVRSLEKGDFTNEVNRYAKGKIIPMVLELSSLGSVQNFVDTFKKNYPELPIDVMILNAAVMITPPELTADGVELQFGVNHLGHFLLVQLLWDDILKSKTRLVHVSSIAHKFSYPEGIRFSQLQSISEYNSVYAYGQSKLANILFSNELAARTNGTGVTSNSLHPGSIASDLQRHIPATFGGKGDSFKRKVIDAVHSLTSPLFNNLISMTAEDGALNQLYVATSPEVSGVTGKYFFPVGDQIDPVPVALNKTLGVELWEASSALVRTYLS